MCASEYVCVCVRSFDIDYLRIQINLSIFLFYSALNKDLQFFPLLKSRATLCFRFSQEKFLTQPPPPPPPLLHTVLQDTTYNNYLNLLAISATTELLSLKAAFFAKQDYEYSSERVVLVVCM